MQLLFATLPLPAKGRTEEEVAQHRLLASQAYFKAVDDYRSDDVEAGVALILQGRLPNFNGNFAPTAPQVSTACRIALEARLKSEHDWRPKLPKPDVVKEPGSQERVKAKLQEMYRPAAQPVEGTDYAALEAERKAREEIARRMAKHDEHFGLDPVDERGMLQRLGYVVGDRDGHEDAA